VNDQLRIGDAERETAARELGEHFALGRITAEEHSERLEQVWDARTAADLRPVFRDLPRPRAEQPPRVAGAGRSGDRPWWPALPRLGFPLRALIVLVVLMVAFHHLWFLLVALLVYVLVVRRFTHRSRWSRRYHGRSFHGRSYAGWQ
jgi:hypothetical protein